MVSAATRYCVSVWVERLTPFFFLAMNSSRGAYGVVCACRQSLYKNVCGGRHPGGSSFHILILTIPLNSIYMMRQRCQCVVQVCIVGSFARLLVVQSMLSPATKTTLLSSYTRKPFLALVWYSTSGFRRWDF